MSNVFKYPIFMTYFDISKIDELFKKKSLLTNIDKPSFISFYREDYHNNSVKCLDDAVRNTLKNKYDYIAKGPIRILTHLRYFGYCFNPVSFYYCFDKSEKNIDAIIAEVTNTPWKQRYCYVLDCQNSEKKNIFKNIKDKKLHVSPFFPMDHEYHFSISKPDKTITIKIDNLNQGVKVHEALLSLNKEDFSKKSLIKALINFPFMTVKVVTAIHWQAIKLWFKGAKLYNNPH